MKAVDIMTTEVVTIDSLATITEAAKVMKQNNLRGLIVERSSPDDAYGIITATDISQAIAQNRDPDTTHVCEVMTKPCIVVNPNLAVEHIARLFAKAKIRLAPVIKDRLLGVVSLTDLLTKTDCLTTNNQVQSLFSQESESFPSEPRPEWEVVDWESEFDNWCSG